MRYWVAAALCAATMMSACVSQAADANVAVKLNERERATLAANLLHPLPPILFDEDEGIAEALRLSLIHISEPTRH